MACRIDETAASRIEALSGGIDRVSTVSCVNQAACLNVPTGTMEGTMRYADSSWWITTVNQATQSVRLSSGGKAGAGSRSEQIGHTFVSTNAMKLGG